MLLSEALLTPFTGKTALRPAEQLRQLLITYAHDVEVVSRERIVQRVMQSELRALFPKTPQAAPITDGANTGHLALILDNAAPKLTDLEKAALACGVSLEEQEVVRREIEHPLPHRRIVGYCAFVCLCAARRSLA